MNRYIYFMDIFLFVKPKINNLFTKKLLSLKYFLILICLFSMKKELKNILAFTLAELVIAITISSIVFLWILNLVWDTLYELWNANRSSEIIVSLNDIIYDFEALNQSYENKEIIISKDEWEWTDILLLSNSGLTWWVLIALVDPNTKRIYNSSTSYPLYNEKYIWCRILDETELANIIATPSDSYTLEFFEDKIFTNIYMKDFQVSLFNSWTISDMELSLLLRYWKESEWISWEDVGNDNLYNVNLNF